MSYPVNSSATNNIVVNSNHEVAFGNDALSEENKIALEKQLVPDELALDQPTDTKVKHNSRKSFLRRSEYSNRPPSRRRENLQSVNLGYYSPVNNIEIIEPLTTEDKAQYNIENKVQKVASKDLKSKKQQFRRNSEGANSLPRKDDVKPVQKRKSLNLRSNTINLDSSSTAMSSSTNNLTTSGYGSCSTSSESSPYKINLSSSGSRPMSNESVLKSPRSNSPRSSLKLSVSGLNSKRITPRKMRISISEEIVAQNSGDELNSARDYLNSLGWILEYIQETDAPVYNHSKKGFSLKKIDDVKPVDRVNSIRKILDKIKNIVANSLMEKGQTEDVQLFEKIIAHVEQANWSKELFNLNLDNRLKVDLELVKKAIEDVKIKNTLFKLSTELVEKILPENLEKDPSEKMTLNDLSLVFPKIPQVSSFSELFSKISALLDKNESELANQCLLEFCIKCLKNGVGWDNDPAAVIYPAVEKICNLLVVPDEMKFKLVEAYQVGLKKAEKINLAKDCLLKKEDEIIGNTKLDLFLSSGFYQLYKSESRKDKKEQIVEQIAKSIVKKTASEFIAIPLDEFLTGMEKKENCPCYMAVGINLDQLSSIVATEILSYIDIADRRKVISFYINVINECLALGDYASALALKTGFDKIPISRLKDTMDCSMWERDVKKQYKTLEGLLTYENKFKNLFSVMSTCKNDYYMAPPVLLGSKVIYAENKINSVKDNLGKECIVQTMLRYLAQEVILPIQKIQERLLNLSEDKVLTTFETFDKQLEDLKSSLTDEDDLLRVSKKLEASKTQ